MNLTIDYTHNSSESNNELAGNIGYNFGWHYNWLFFHKKLQLLVGAMVENNFGFIYNTHGSNNPAQVKASIDIAPSIQIIYHFNTHKNPLQLRYQLNMSLIGLMFTPNYGQSYYELFSEGNYDHNIAVTTPFNAPTLSQMLTVDFRLWGTTLRIGYVGNIRQSDVNNLKYHEYTHTIMIGYVKRFCLIK